MYKLTISLLFLMSFQLLAGSKVECSDFKDAVEFMKVEVKKFPHETLNFAIEADQNCSLGARPKVFIYWKAKPGKAGALGFDCASPNGIIKSVVAIDDVEKLSSNKADLRMDVLETATKNTNKKMSEWLRVELRKSGDSCLAKTNVEVDNQSHSIHKIYIDKATVSFTLSPRITKAILYKGRGRTITIEKD